MATKKKPASGKSKKPTGGGKSQQSAKNNTRKEREQRTQRSILAYVAPYVLMTFALLLVISFILILFEGDIGVLGEGIRSLFSGLLGFGVYMLPLVAGYIGVRWCLFNLNWDFSLKLTSDQRREDYIRAAKRNLSCCIMSIVLLIIISTFSSVIAEQDYFDLAAFWQDGWDGEGGGILGGMLGCLFLVCFDSVLSIVILSILAVVFALLTVGLTPNYVIRLIQEKHVENAINRAEEQEKAEKQTKKAVKEIKKTPAVVPPTPQSEKEETHSVPVTQVFEVTDSPAPSDNGNANKTPLDFGGDHSFDTNEFNNINNILEGLGTPITPSVNESEKKPASPAAPISMDKMDSSELLSDVEAVAPDEDGEEVPEVITPYVFPSVELLNKNKDVDNTDHTKESTEKANVLVETLNSFRVGVESVAYSRGPTITRFEIKPKVGTRVRSIANLVDDIALNLATAGVRIEAPIPGKAAVGIEVPNEVRATVYLRDLIDNAKFTDAKSKLTAALGMDVGGNPIYFDIGKMPHLLIAGTTGSGKSICINCIIMSILYKAKPEELKLILIDPKKVEFNMYKNIPHLYCPIVSEPKKAAGALASAVAEMERRFEMIESVGVRDIAGYNAIAESDPELEFMPHMVIIIDELADLMMTARDEVETSICRLAQKARAAGIHVILGTQRPSVDVITGLIKANVPSRIACTVMSQVDSRTIIDVAGAESLIGRGDMLFAPVGASKPLRVQGAFVSDGEVERIVDFIKENNGEARYNKDFVNRIEEEAAKCGMGKKGAAAGGSFDSDGGDVEGGDSKFSEAVKIVIEAGKASTSLLQRRINVGYGRAAKMLDTMQELGYISAPEGTKPRRVLITMDEYLRRKVEGNLGDSDSE